MNTKFITFLLALICSLPMMAKVYTVMSPNKSLVVNISVDKTLKWEIKSGKTIVLLPSEIALQTDKQCLGKNMKVKKSSICNNKVGNRKYQQLTLGAGDYDLQFRVFDDAAAYRFISKKVINKVINETSEFIFADDYPAFVPYVMITEEGSAGVIHLSLIMTRFLSPRCIKIPLPSLLWL